MIDQKPPMNRMLDRPAKLVDRGKSAGRVPWWRLKGAFSKPGAVHNFSLLQDGGEEIAAVSTTLEPDDGSFRKGMRCRRTVVTFKDGEWKIITRAPRPQDEAKARSFVSKPWRREDRIVEVVTASPGAGEGEQIAYLANPSAWRILGSIQVTTADGQTVILAPQTVGRRFLTGEKLTIEKIRAGYRLTPKSPVPLEAVLLHWHVMLGDIRVPRPGGGNRP
jgi:hypothetical protein